MVDQSAGMKAALWVLRSVGATAGLKVLTRAVRSVALRDDQKVEQLAVGLAAM